MSDLMTRITLPGFKPFGMLDWGRRSQEEMIAQARAHSKRLKEEAKAIDQACDWDFQIDVVRGPIVQRHVETVQLSSLS